MKSLLFTVVMLVFFAGALFAQITSIKLPTADNNSSFVVRDNNNAVLSKIFGYGGFYMLGGISNGAALPISGARVCLMWDPFYAAFRAGNVNSTQWDAANIGVCSIALGYNTTAHEFSSTAMGNSTTASGNSSTAMDFNTTASGNSSTAMGNGTIASGDNSTALGYNTTASGNNSTAMGNYTTANGFSSTAMGTSTTASGDHSTAMGYNTIANAFASTAMGDSTIASGLNSTALGFKTTASGGYSIAMGSGATASGGSCTAIGRNVTANGGSATAMGNYVSTNGYNGSFIIGDISTTTDVTNSSAFNQMTMRFAGGYVLYSNVGLTTGVHMDAGVSGWTNICDRNKKQSFRPVDGEELLKKIRTIPITEWSYKGADASIRYIGPMAQDFYSAFHLGGKDSLGINSICIDGVNMAAIQALEKRTAELQKATAKIAELEKMVSGQQEELTSRDKDIDELKSDFIQLKKEIAAMMELKPSSAHASLTSADLPK